MICKTLPATFNSLPVTENTRRKMARVTARDRNSTFKHRFHYTKTRSELIPDSLNKVQVLVNCSCTKAFLFILTWCIIPFLLRLNGVSERYARAGGVSTNQVQTRAKWSCDCESVPNLAAICGTMTSLRGVSPSDASP